MNNKAWKALKRDMSSEQVNILYICTYLLRDEMLPPALRLTFQIQLNLFALLSMKQKVCGYSIMTMRYESGDDHIPQTTPTPIIFFIIDDTVPK